MKTILALLCIVAAIHAECDQSQSFPTYNVWQGPSGAQLVLYGPPVLLVPWPTIVWQVAAPGCSPSPPQQNKREGQQSPCALQWRLHEQGKKDVGKISHSNDDKSNESKTSNKEPRETLSTKSEEENSVKRPDPTDDSSGESQSSTEHNTYPTRPNGNLQPGIEWYLQNLQHMTTNIPSDRDKIPHDQMSVNEGVDDAKDSDENHATKKNKGNGAEPTTSVHDESQEDSTSSPIHKKDKNQNIGKWKETSIEKPKPEQQMVPNNAKREREGSEAIDSTENSGEDESGEPGSSAQQPILPSRPEGKKKRKDINWSAKNQQQNKAKGKTSKPARHNKTPNGKENENKESDESYSSGSDEQDHVKPINSTDEESDESKSSEEQKLTPGTPKDRKKHKSTRWTINKKHPSTANKKPHKPGQEIIASESDIEGSQERRSTESSNEEESGESRSSEKQPVPPKRPEGKEKRKDVNWSAKNEQQNKAKGKIPKPAQHKTPNGRENENKESDESSSSGSDEQDHVKPINPTNEESDESKSSEEQKLTPGTPKDRKKHKSTRWTINKKHPSTANKKPHKPGQEIIASERDIEGSQERRSTESSNEEESGESRSSEKQPVPPKRPEGKEKRKDVNWSAKNEQQNKAKGKIPKPAQHKTPNGRENENKESDESSSSGSDEQDHVKPINSTDEESDESKSSEEQKLTPGTPKDRKKHTRWIINKKHPSTANKKPHKPGQEIIASESDIEGSQERRSTERSNEEESGESRSSEKQPVPPKRPEGKEKRKDVNWSAKNQQQNKAKVKIPKPAQHKTPNGRENENKESDESSSSGSDEQDHVKPKNPTNEESDESKSSEEQKLTPETAKGRKNNKSSRWTINKKHPSTANKKSHKPGQGIIVSESELEGSQERRSTESSDEEESGESRSSEETHSSATRPNEKKPHRNIKFDEVKQMNTSTAQSNSNSTENRTKPPMGIGSVIDLIFRSLLGEDNKEKLKSEETEENSPPPIHKSDSPPVQDDSDSTSTSESEEDHTSATSNQREQQGQENQNGGVTWGKVPQHVTDKHSKASVDETSDETSSQESEKDDTETKLPNIKGKVQKPPSSNPSTTLAEGSNESKSSGSEEMKPSTLGEDESLYPGNEGNYDQTAQLAQENRGGVVQWLWNKNKKQRESNVQQPSTEQTSANGNDEIADDSSSSESEENHSTTTPQQTETHDQGNLGGVVKWIVNKKQRQSSTSNPSTQPAEEDSDESKSSESEEVKPSNLSEDEPLYSGNEGDSSTNQAGSQVQGDQSGIVQWLWNKNKKQRESKVQQSTTERPSSNSDEENSDETSSSESEESHSTPTPQQNEGNSQGGLGGTIKWAVSKKQRQSKGKPSSSTSQEEESESESSESEEVKPSTLGEDESSNTVNQGNYSLTNQAGLQTQENQGGVVQWLWNKNKKQRESELQQSTTVNPSKNTDEEISDETSSSESEESHSATTPQQTEQNVQGELGGVVKWVVGKKVRQSKSKSPKPSSSKTQDEESDESSESEEVKPSTLGEDESSNTVNQGNYSTSNQAGQQSQENQGGVVQWLWNKSKKQRESKVQQSTTVRPPANSDEENSDETSSSESEESHSATTPHQTVQNVKGELGGVVNWVVGKKEWQSKSKSSKPSSSTTQEEESDESESSESEEVKPSTLGEDESSNTVNQGNYSTSNQAGQQSQENQGGVVQWLWNKNKKQRESKVQQSTTKRPSSNSDEENSDETSSSESEESHSTPTPQQNEENSPGELGGMIKWTVSKKQRQSKAKEPSSSTTQEEESDESESSESEEVKPSTLGEDESSFSVNQGNYSLTNQAGLQTQENHGGVVQWLWNKNKKQRESELQQSTTVNPSKNTDEEISDETSSSESEESHSAPTPQQTEQNVQGELGGVVKWVVGKKVRQSKAKGKKSSSSTTQEEESDESESSESEEVKPSTLVEDASSFSVNQGNYSLTNQAGLQTQENQGGVVQWLWNKNKKQRESKLQQSTTVNPSKNTDEEISDETSSSESEESHSATTPQQTEQNVQGELGGVVKWTVSKKQRQSKAKGQKSSSSTTQEEESDESGSSESEEVKPSALAEDASSFSVNQGNYSLTNQAGLQTQENQGGVVQWLWNKNKKQRESELQQSTTVNPSKNTDEEISDETSSSESEESHSTTTPQQTEQNVQGELGGVVKWVEGKKVRQSKSKSTKPSSSKTQEEDSDESSESEEEKPSTLGEDESSYSVNQGSYSLTNLSGQQAQENQGGVVQWLWNKNKKQRESNVQQPTTEQTSANGNYEIADDSSSSESEESHSATTPQQTEQNGQGELGGVAQWLVSKKQSQSKSKVQKPSSSNTSTTVAEDKSDESSESEELKTSTLAKDESTYSVNQGNYSLSNQTGQKAQENQGGVVQWLWNKNKKQRESNVQQSIIVNEKDSNIQQSPTSKPSTTRDEVTSDDSLSSESGESYSTIASQDTELQSHGDRNEAQQESINKESQQSSQVQLSTSVVPSAQDKAVQTTSPEGGAQRTSPTTQISVNLNGTVGSALDWISKLQNSVTIKTQQDNKVGGQQKISNSQIDLSKAINKYKALKWFASKL